MNSVLVLIVLCTAIVGLFSQEFTAMFKRIFSIPGAPLFLPLIFISLLIETHLVWGWVILTSIRSGLYFLEAHLTALLPQSFISDLFVRVFILTLLPVIPIVVSEYLTRNNQLSDPMFYTFRVSAVIWLISTILFVSII